MTLKVFGFTLAVVVLLSEAVSCSGIGNEVSKSTSVSLIKDRTPNINTRIIGGQVAEPHQFPYQVAVHILVIITNYLCGGTLIHPEWVLTAAHCVEYATNITLRLGAHNISADEENSRLYHTTDYIIHEDWDLMTITYDIALVKLPERVELNEFIAVIPIARGSETFSGLMSITLGWGLTELGFLDVLRYVEAEVITNEECSATEEYTPYILDQHLCTSGIGMVGSCSSDSGGAVVVDGVQVGIVSFGVPDCAASKPSVNVRITYFYDWIEEKIGEDLSPRGNGTVRSTNIMLILLVQLMTLLRCGY